MAIATTAAPALDSITFLTAVIVVLWGGFIFLAKYQFSQMNKSIETNQSELNKSQKETKEALHNFQLAVRRDFSESVEKLSAEVKINNEKVNGRIDKLQQELNDVKGDFATTFVLREDFFRAMNGVEDNIRETGRKVDKILLLMGDKQKGV